MIKIFARKKLKLIILLFLLSISTTNAEILLRQQKNLYCHDGDTCYVTIDGQDAKIRLLELDTPEITLPKCDAELELASKARDFVNNLIKDAKSIEFETDYERDYYGRILSYLIIDGQDVSALLVKKGLGVVLSLIHI